VKLNPDGFVKPQGLVVLDKYEYEIDYDETFVTKMTIARIFLSLTTSMGLYIYQIDVKNLFIHGELTKDIYMTPPQGLSSSFTGVCKLTPCMV